MYENGYVPPILTVDMVLFSLIDGKLSALLIERAQEPFKGAHALPGGYNAAGETTHEAVTRVMKAKAGIDTADLSLIEQLHAFDTVARDPRGHAVSITYMGLATNVLPEGSKTTQNPLFFPVKDLPQMAYDHADIIKFAHKRLITDISTSNTIFALLPRLFTLTQLQGAYEAILGRELDKRNFRKKFLSLGMVTATDEYYRDGAHRPAQLYKFNKQTVEPFSRSFE